MYVYQTALSEVSSSLTGEYIQYLNPQEKARLAEITHPQKRKQYLVGRALIRDVLSRHISSAPEKIELMSNQYGKPLLADNSLQFNISNKSNELVMVLSTDSAVGVDIEDASLEHSHKAVAKKFFCQSEIAHLQSLSGAELSTEFFYYWTLKEAYLKAQGVGLTQPMTSIEFRINKQKIQYQTTNTISASFKLYQPQPHQIWAIAHLSSSPINPKQFTQVIPFKAHQKVPIPNAIAST